MYYAPVMGLAIYLVAAVMVMVLIVMVMHVRDVVALDKSSA